MELHHLALGATNVESLSRFYHHVFGLEERTRHFEDAHLRSIWLELGSGVIMIEKVNDENGWERKMRRGVFLVAFRVTKEERKRVEEAIEKEGGTLETRTEYTTYARDPEDNRIAISIYSL